MTKFRLMLTGAALTLVTMACEQNAPVTATDTRSGTTGTVPAFPADNSARNERDRDGSTMTPLDQKENETDLALTQKIRQEVVGADGLSMSAKNIKIISADGIVTLRGPVKSAEERTRIVAIATAVAGADKVDDQLEVE